MKLKLGESRTRLNGTSVKPKVTLSMWMWPIYQTPFVSAKSLFEDQHHRHVSGCCSPITVCHTRPVPHPRDVPAPLGMSPHPEPPRWAPQAPQAPGLTLLCAPVWRMTLRSSTFPTGTRDMLRALRRARAGRGAAGAAGGV